MTVSLRATRLRDRAIVTAHDERGLEIGVVRAWFQGRDLRIGFMSLRYIRGSDGARYPVLLTDEGEAESIPHEDYTRRGLGVKLANAMLVVACREGKRLASGTDRSPLYERFWQKQVEAGLARIAPAEPLYEDDQDYEFVVDDPCRHPGFR